jgi:signal transduction histidine kinase
MNAVVYPSSRVQSERTIAIARVVLAATALFAVWLDPAEPAQYAGLTYTLYWFYVVYSAVMVAWTIFWTGGDRLPVVTHAADIVVFSVFQYLTLGPSSPFFVYFIFSMFCGAVRWGWRGTLVTGGLVMLFYVGMAASIAPRIATLGLEVNRFVVRLAYLIVATGMLVYLGRYEARLRLEIERLARWPAPLEGGPEAAIARMLEYAAGLMQAGCVLAVWEANDEPLVHEARWTADGFTVRSHAPGALRMIADETLADATFISTGPIAEARSILLTDAVGRLVRRDGMPLDAAIVERLSGAGLASSSIKTDLVTGRVYFCDLGTPASEAVPLTEVVTREIASSLDQLHSAQQRQELAAREERVRVARDLHDGVLQGLTGVRLELRAIANERHDSPDALRQQLASLERALAMEQRELRFFISGLEPGADQRIDGQSNLAVRLDSMRERLALEWKTPVTLRVSPRVASMPEPIAEAIPLMVHEATVNALKHAHPSRVAVDVDAADGHVRIAVTDDGRGFPFRGRYNHETLAASRVAPRSLFDRVSALGGTLSIESTDRGSRVEMLLSV